MGRIVPVKPVGVTEDGCRFFERYAMFLKIGDRLRHIPGKHLSVYTVIDVRLQSTRIGTPEALTNSSLRLRRPPGNHGGTEEHE